MTAANTKTSHCAPETTQCYICADVVLAGTIDDEGWCEDCANDPSLRGPLNDDTGPLTPEEVAFESRS